MAAAVPRLSSSAAASSSSTLNQPTLRRHKPSSSLPSSLRLPLQSSPSLSHRLTLRSSVPSLRLPCSAAAHQVSVFDTDDKPHEQCGVFGIIGDPDAAEMCYLGLHALQHRGQEGAGIVSSDGSALHSVTGLGLVSEVFPDASKLAPLVGSAAIGHNRYSTSGAASALANVQPFVAGYRFGQLAVAHNGNLVNYRSLRHELESKGSIFSTTSDTEVILHLIATSAARPLIARIVEACESLSGAFSLVFLTADKLIAVRDPHGFRPLVMGRRPNGAVVFASETSALDLISAEYVREVNPGEVIAVDVNDMLIATSYLLTRKPRKSCVFEHIYFGSPNSIIFGHPVHASRYNFGAALARESPAPGADIVIPVPDSGLFAALGFAGTSGVPFKQGLIRSHYVGRSFIAPNQEERDLAVKLKLAPVEGILAGKSVVVIDDSIVRGTTSSKIVRLIKNEGKAREVHMRIACPPIVGSCYYGVDTPRAEELISNRLGVDELRQEIGCDSLGFLSLESMKGAFGEGSHMLCDACFTRKYPVTAPEPLAAEVGDEAED
ncbi:amidophosphoribosyltransferase, chloroplastic-like [Zingiber officinale]|uniref:Amidophosphoribosyltransferase n=1 Tax=Zingiber officinale TaxID=94328 RepID=A0A8J5KH22_ZINOF|nr:amidophosphoribosyltransferase, chloroplastic-like [Zingiber officinale]KAG6480087.1 hypothetical protein ZIOFF_063565 [Zingiber officinale]